jgi:hypothetical protein
MAVEDVERMDAAIREWVDRLDNYPGWKEWRKKRIGHTLYADESDLWPNSSSEKEFRFDKKVEGEHAVVILYMNLKQTVASLRDCEFYFRRYPFRGLPVSRYSHVTTICEMYFYRFYEFKERLKKYFDALSLLIPGRKKEFGNFIKDFDREFNQELRERNNINHHSRFEDIEIDRVLLMDTLGLKHESWIKERNVGYRKLVREWSQRVRVRAARMDEFLQEISKFTLDQCEFIAVDKTTQESDSDVPTS